MYLYLLQPHPHSSILISSWRRKMAEGEVEKEQKVDPWTVKAAEGAAKIDYDKLIGESKS